MLRPLSRTALRVVVAVWLAVLLLALLLLGATPRLLPAAQAAPSLEATADHPFSDPTWFPLREPAKIGCAKSGCGTRSDHGYDAIDLLGAQGDPVYAAGAGIAHIGGNSGACKSSSESQESGRWIWVDHGGGVVSRYHHLDSIKVKEGQLVTPATEIGTMGHSGDIPPCTTNYLHFEVRHGGVSGDRVDFGPLRGCGSKGLLRLPQALGFTSWNDPGLHPAQRFSSPTLDSRCITAEWTTTAGTPALQVSRARGAVTVAVDAPAGAGSWAADLQIWRPSLKAWRTLSVSTVAAGAGITVFTDGVEDARRYRVRVGIHSGAGWSAWSGYREAVGLPAAPSVRYLQWKKKSSSSKSYLHYGWTRPDELGGTVKGYTVARRCGSTSSSLGGWKTSTTGGSTEYKNLRSLKKVKVCEVRVQARNAAGTGAWSTTKRISR